MEIVQHQKLQHQIVLHHIDEKIVTLNSSRTKSSMSK